MNKQESLYCKYIKRCIDVVLSIMALLILSPIMGILALLISRKLGHPVLFKQERAGLHEESFVLFKFRSMLNETDTQGNLLPDEARLTSFGNKIRMLSLDELPGLINVLKGEMSIIGPRPLPINYLPLYNDFQKGRHEVKPGIVGLAGVRGRNNQSWDSKFKNDIEYVETISFITDLKIFFKAIIVVFKREDINCSGHITGEPFIQSEHKGKGI